MSEARTLDVDPLPQVPPARHRWISRYYRAKEHPGRRRLLGWMKRLLGVQIVRVEVAPGVLMDLDDRDYVESEILFHGGYELATLQLFERLIASADGFVDIGAHHGQYSLRAARILAPRGHRVVSFEPMPHNAAALLRNAALSRITNLDLYCIALAREPAIASMILPSIGNTGGARLGSTSGVATSPTMHVSVRSIAELAHRWPPGALDLLKIDVEGREVDALAPLFAAGLRPKHILLEYIPSHFDYGIAESVPAWLESHGYEVCSVSGQPYRPGEALPDDNLWARLRRPSTGK